MVPVRGFLSLSPLPRPFCLPAYPFLYTIRRLPLDAVCTDRGVTERLLDRYGRWLRRVHRSVLSAFLSSCLSPSVCCSSEGRKSEQAFHLLAFLAGQQCVFLFFVSVAFHLEKGKKISHSSSLV